MNRHHLVWFRSDLRIDDNPALVAAARDGVPVLPVYIHCPDDEAPWAPGGASRWWLHHALRSLEEELGKLGLPLIVKKGNPREVIRELAASHNVSAVYWNRRYEPAVIERDRKLKASLKQDGLDTESFNASLLFEPWAVQKADGTPFRVFTPYWKNISARNIEPPHIPDSFNPTPPDTPDGGWQSDELSLLPGIPWDREFPEHWNPTIPGASDVLNEFVSNTITLYKDKRDWPSIDATSRLSPYLHFGQLGPRQVWAAVFAGGHADSGSAYKFLSEIGWREFAHHLLFHFPKTPEEPLSDAYRDFPWQADPKLLEAWQKGQTGYPIVDAGMRQLWRSGWMHNRVRMIVASVLVKHLLQPWQDGAAWFWDTLVDADLASNTMGWQWTAGCGADAAPYFRIFNPMLQGEKFDPDGAYIRRWVPELGKLDGKYIHKPWEAPSHVLHKADIKLDDTYPRPVIDHAEGRKRALDALALNKQRNAA